MVAVVSKLLLLVALFSGIENAVEGSNLSYDHFPQSLPRSSLNALKSGKSSKSGKSAKKSKTVGIGKGSKSPKADKYLHVDEDLTVEYTVVENYESDVDVVEKPIKTSKNEASYDGSDKVKSAKSDDGSDGVKSSKSDTDASANKSSKADVRKVPPPSPPPTEIGTFGIEVPGYSLVYTLVFNNEPSLDELYELNEATRSYLDAHFMEEFDEDDFTIYSQFVNQIDEITAISNTQVAVGYDSIVRFGQSSLIKPMPIQLGSAIGDAFTGVQMIQYEEWLAKMLPNGNVFVGSKVEYYNGDTVPDTSIAGMAGIAASAAAVTLLVAGLVLYKSSPDKKANNMGKLNKSPGDLTIAGETYAGETYDGMASISTSADYGKGVNDEEDGREIENLGSIPETDAEEIKDKGGIFRLAPNNILGAFRANSKATQKTPSFEDVALQAPTSGDRYQDNIMPDPSSSDDDESQMSDSELSQFVANQTAGSHTLEIKSILSQDSMDQSTIGDLSVRDNSSRRLRTVAEIEALLSSELNDDNSGSGSRTSRSTIQAQLQMGRPRTVEEIESLLTAEDDDSLVELPAPFEDVSSIDDC